MAASQSVPRVLRTPSPPSSEGPLMTRMIRLPLLVAAVLAAAAPLAMAQDMTGAGATFPAPVYAKWADAYHKATGARLNYQSVGSGAGIQQIRAKTVDFGASDMPSADDAL